MKKILVVTASPLAENSVSCQLAGVFSGRHCTHTGYGYFGQWDWKLAGCVVYAGTNEHHRANSYCDLRLHWFCDADRCSSRTGVHRCFSAGYDFCSRKLRLQPRNSDDYSRDLRRQCLFTAARYGSYDYIFQGILQDE